MPPRPKRISAKRHQDRCSNPFTLDKHYKTEGLRYPSTKILKANPHLRESDLLCVPCRKRIEKEIERVDNPNNVESTEPPTETISTLYSEKSDLSIETKLPVINDALKMIGHSPIPKKRLRGSSDRWVEKKVVAVASTLKQSLGTAAGPSASEVEDNSWNTAETLEELKKKFHHPDSDKNLKIQILTILPGNWSIAKIAREMETTLYMARAAKKLHQEKEILSKPMARLDKTLPSELKMKIMEFYEDDEMSAPMPGMKDFISVRDEDGKRVHRQKRLILCNLKELYHIFQKRYSDLKVGFSTFASLRPKHCVLAGSSGTHTVCVCSVHQNVKLMIQGCSLSVLTENADHHLSNYEDCLNLLICNDSTPRCYLGDCQTCPGDKVLRDTLVQALDMNDIEELSYKQWVSKPRTSLETITKCAEEFAGEFCDQAKTLLRHSFIASKQSEYMKSLKNSLKIGEALVQCDFAENYSFVVQNAAPGFHWNNSQATLYPVVVYYKERDTVEHKSLVIISDCLHHDSIAVHVFSGLINNFIHSFIDNPSKLYYCSDGAPQQFKNYKNFVNVYEHEHDFGVPAEWHFCATAHGKGPCDGLGGTVKRLAARASLQLPMDQQITTPEELFQWADSNIPGIAIRYTNVDDYNNAQNLLQERFKNARSIPRTQKCHCLIPATNGTVKTKIFSSDLEFETHRILKS